MEIKESKIIFFDEFIWKNFHVKKPEMVEEKRDLNEYEKKALIEAMKEKVAQFKAEQDYEFHYSDVKKRFGIKV